MAGVGDEDVLAVAQGAGGLLAVARRGGRIALAGDDRAGTSEITGARKLAGIFAAGHPAQAACCRRMRKSPRKVPATAAGISSSRMKGTSSAQVTPKK